jgi:hypothetical protein
VLAVGALAARLPGFVRYDDRTDEHAARQRELRAGQHSPLG